MIKIKARLYQKEDTLREIECENSIYVADVYAHEYVDMFSGDVVYIEALSEVLENVWLLWRVECLGFGWYRTGLRTATEFEIETHAANARRNALRHNIQ